MQPTLPAGIHLVMIPVMAPGLPADILATGPDGPPNVIPRDKPTLSPGQHQQTGPQGLLPQESYGLQRQPRDMDCSEVPENWVKMKVYA